MIYDIWTHVPCDMWLMTGDIWNILIILWFVIWEYLGYDSLEAFSVLLKQRSSSKAPTSAAGSRICLKQFPAKLHWIVTIQAANFEPRAQTPWNRAPAKWLCYPALYRNRNTNTWDQTRLTRLKIHVDRKSAEKLLQRKPQENPWALPGLYGEVIFKMYLSFRHVS